MRVRSLLSAVVLLATCVFAVEVSPVEEVAEPTEPELVVVASFPESNPFGHVVNGENNQLYLDIENKSGKNLTLLSVAGAFHHPETDKLIKATNNLTYGIYLIEGAKMRLPYSFYSEFKTGDTKLNLWLEHITEGKRYRVSAYDSIVTIVEPELSFLDFKLLTTYAMVLGIVSALGYFAYLTFIPQPKRVRKPVVSAPVGTVTATGAGGYQEEWIPQHHLKKGKSKKTGAVGSGDEPSGGETSGAEGKKKKSRK